MIFIRQNLAAAEGAATRSRGYETSSANAVAYARLTLAASAAALAIMAMPAWAQNAASQERTEAADEPVPDSANEIIVTANRRAERLQDVPTSITAVTSEKLTESGFQNAGDLQYLVPSLTFNPSATGNSFQIRGIGIQSSDVGLEKPVAVVVDEVVQGVPRDPGFSTFADIERVEVLRGPQGTLFGKNASAGVVSVITRRPQLGKTEAIGHFRYGTGNEVYAEATVNAPMSDSMALRLTGVLQSREGWLYDVLTAKPTEGYKDIGVRAKWLWEPSAAVSVYLIGDYQRHRDGGESVMYTIRTRGNFTNAANTQDLAAVLAPYGITPSADNIRVAQDRPSAVDSEGKGLTATVSVDLGGAKLTSISAYRKVTNAILIDADYSPNDWYNLNDSYLQGRQVTQELRLNSSSGGFFDYVLGLYYYNLHTTAQERQGARVGRVLPDNTRLSPNGGVNNYDIRSESFAAFGQADLNFSEKITGVIGLRYTNDKVRGVFFLTPDRQYTFIPFTTVKPNAADRASADDLSGRVSLQYKPNRDLMFYATVARGYKGPTVGTSAGTVTPVKPETVWSYEIGVKSALFGGRLTLNASAFTQEFRNFQAVARDFLPSGIYAFRLTNADSMTSKGIEADAVLRVTPSFSLNGNVAYVPSKFKRYLGSCYAGQPLLGAPGAGCYIDPASNARVYNLAGQRTPFAPWLTGNVGFSFDPMVGPDLKLFTDANYSFRSKFISNTGDPRTMVDGYGLLNANIGIGSQDGRWRIGVYARNLLDKQFPNRILTLGTAPSDLIAQQAAVNADRTVGIRLDAGF